MATAATKSPSRSRARSRVERGSGPAPRPARGRLLEAAAELAPLKGYEQLRVGELARAAKVSRETFYTHFAGKRQCVSEACEPRLAAVEQQLREAANQGHSWAAPMLKSLDQTLAGLYSSPESPRARLLTAMLDEVARRGYNATRMGPVLSAAGLTQTQFYRQFAGKRDCFATAAANLIQKLEAEVGGSLEQLTNRLVGEPQTARILLLEIGALPEPAADVQGEAGPRSFVDLVECILFGARSEEASAQARRLAVGAVVETLRSDVIRGNYLAMSERAGELRRLAYGEPMRPRLLAVS